MTNTTIACEQHENDLLVYEVSDEALEAAVRAGQGNAASFTLGACTGLTVCPG